MHPRSRFQWWLAVMLAVAAIVWLVFPDNWFFDDKPHLPKVKIERDLEDSPIATQNDDQPLRPADESIEAVQMVKRLGGTVRLQANGDVIAINLTGTDVRKSDLLHLAKTPKLKLLNLDNTSTGDEELKLIHDFPELQVLRLCRTSTTNTGLSHLQNLPSLSLLLLNDTRVTDEGLEQLPDLPSLTLVEVLGCSVTPAAREVFHARRPGCRIKYK